MWGSVVLCFCLLLRRYPPHIIMQVMAAEHRGRRSRGVGSVAGVCKVLEERLKHVRTLEGAFRHYEKCCLCSLQESPAARSQLTRLPGNCRGLFVGLYSHSVEKEFASPQKRVRLYSGNYEHCLFACAFHS